METNRNNNIRELYNEICNKLEGFTPTKAKILKKEDDTRMKMEERLKILGDAWKKYLGTFPNTHTEKNTHPFGHRTYSRPAEEIPTHDEMKEAIKSLKNNKTPAVMANLQNSSNSEETLSMKCVLIPIPKKKNKMIRSNYRGTSLLKTTYRIPAMVLVNIMGTAENEDSMVDWK